MSDKSVEIHLERIWEKENPYKAVLNIKNSTTNKLVEQGNYKIPKDFNLLVEALITIGTTIPPETDVGKLLTHKLHPSMDDSVG